MIKNHDDMKANNVILGLALIVTGVLTMVSCTKNDDTTIVPIGTEYYIEDIFEVVSDSAFWADFGTIHQGPIPPNIEGSYLIAPKLRIGTNVPGMPSELLEPNADLHFTHQHNGLVVMDLNESAENVTDTVYVMGSGSNFTAYCIEDKSYDMTLGNTSYHVDYRRGIVISGKVTTEGISDFRYATIIMSAKSQPAGAPMQDVGSYFIYKDNDNLAERLTN